MLARFPDVSHPLKNELNKRVVAIAQENGDQIFLVGGYIRDALLQRPDIIVKDLDYAVAQHDGTSGAAMRLAAKLASTLDAHLVPLDEINDTARVVLKTGEVIDLAGCVGGSIQADIMRRDFSMNALVWDPTKPDEILDQVNGVADIAQRRIRAITQQSFADDPLRMLRAFRFSATMGGAIDEQTLDWIAQYADRLPVVAAERINYELFLALAVRRSAPIVVQMADCGLLENIFPELRATHKVTANAFHHLGLFDHSVETIPQLEAKLPQMSDWVMESADSELSFGVTRLAATKVACLLHDIGKPETWAITPEGRHTFYAHDKLGADMCEEVGERMKWARPVERLIVKLVRWHLRPGALFHQGPPTDKAVRRFYRSIGDDLPELMLLSFADFGATRGPGLMGEGRAEHERALLDLLEGYPPYKEECKTREKLLNGKDIMDLLSVPPGPIVGELLAALDEAQEFKEVQNRDDAEGFIRSLYQQKYSK